MTNFESVRKFMETFGQEIREKAEFPNEKVTSLRHDLIKEELDELKEAIDNQDIKEVYKELNSYFKTSTEQIQSFIGSNNNFFTGINEIQNAIKIFVAEKIGKKRRNFAIGIVSFSSQLISLKTFPTVR